ncbi:MAG: HAMP domain-containing histidine kinase [Deltaproteobacteria bacterium]|nr:HAMP domain-containing histidine kinase [Deltaproteobacteria bacterium]
MPRKPSTHLIVSYVLSLGLTTSLLVGWVIYIVRSQAKINELASRVGVRRENFHWLILGIGCVLFGLLIVGLTHQMAQALSERRYAMKQEEFVSNITHEMKSPLAAIRLHAETLMQGGVSQQEHSRSLGYILQQQERMTQLVDNVLETSRLVARKRALALEEVALRPFLEAYLEEARERVTLQNRRLFAKIDTSSRVLATEGALHRVLDNLVSNAVRFSSPGGEVRCLVVDTADRVTIAVEDDGVGIPKSELRRVFDRFYQSGRKAGGSRKGTGLGLAIVEGLVKEMNGTVRAFSQEGWPGSRFEIELPRLEEPHLGQ